MASLGWSIYTWNGTIWVSDGTIPRPNSSMQIPMLSTQVRLQLMDGSDAYQSPETKSSKQSLVMNWVQQDHDFVEQLRGYIEDNEYLKIVTHISGEEYIGRFIAVTPTWLVGVEDEFEIEATFEVME